MTEGLVGVTLVAVVTGWLVVSTAFGWLVLLGVWSVAAGLWAMDRTASRAVKRPAVPTDARPRARKERP